MPQGCEPLRHFLFGGATQSRTGLDGFAIDGGSGEPYFMRVLEVLFARYADATHSEFASMQCNRAKKD